MLPRQCGIVFLTIALYLMIVAVLLVFSLSGTRGTLVYALDDPYIHMTIAGNLANHGVWGINKEGYSACSSSSLYTLILAGAFYLLGIQEVIPLVINIIAGAAALLITGGILRKYYDNSKLIFIFLLSIMFISPLFAVTFVGMEHTAHLAVSVLFLYFASGIISSEDPGGRKIGPLLVTAPVLMGLRYESVFMVLTVCALLLARRRFRDAAITGIAAAVPVVIYGLISFFQGSNFIPNPVLLKGNTPYFSLWGAVWWGIQVYNNISSPHIILLFIGALAAYLYLSRERGEFWNQKKVALIIFISAAFMHMVFASTEWFFRYDAYLVAMGLVSIFAGFSSLFGEGAFSRRVINGRNRKADLVIAVFILMVTITPFLYRAASLFMVPRASVNIYQQQYQMGLFIQRYYSGEAVAVNDAGAVSFLADIETVDLWGLGNERVLRAKKGNYFNTEWIDRYTRKRNVKVAVLYENWFSGYGGLPAGWKRVARWTIPHEIVCGEPTVTFFAVDEREEDRLREHLGDFSSELPAAVRVKVF